MARDRPTSEQSRRHTESDLLRRTVSKKEFNKLQKERDALKQREDAVIDQNKTITKALKAAHSLAMNVMEHEAESSSSLTSRAKEVLDRVRQTGLIEAANDRKDQEMTKEASEILRQGHAGTSARDNTKNRKAQSPSPNISESEPSAGPSPTLIDDGDGFIQLEDLHMDESAAGITAAPQLHGLISSGARARNRNQRKKKARRRARERDDPFQHVQIPDLSVRCHKPRRAGQVQEDRAEPMATVAQEQWYTESVAAAEAEKATASHLEEDDDNEPATETTGRRKKPNLAERMGRSRRGPKP